MPLFDPAANLAATCPTNKLEEDAKGLVETLGVPVRKLTEEGLYTAFDVATDVSDAPADEADFAPVCAPVGKAPAFSFAMKFNCECPKCVVPEGPKV